MFSTQLHAMLGDLTTLGSTEHTNRITDWKVLLLARVFKLGQLFIPSAHAHIQDLSAGSHPWRLPRVSVPFVESQHHEAPVRAHAVRAGLPSRGTNGIQGSKL